MTDDRHPTATRTTRLEQAQALLREGSNAAESEIAWARRVVAEHASKPEPSLYDRWKARTPHMADYRRRGTPEQVRIIEDALREAERNLIDLESVHEAEVHAGKIGMFVVWRSDQSAADSLQCWDSPRIRIPSGEVTTDLRCCGLMHDTEVDRWGVLYLVATSRNRSRSPR